MVSFYGMTPSNFPDCDMAHNYVSRYNKPLVLSILIWFYALLEAICLIRV